MLSQSFSLDPPDDAVRPVLLSIDVACPDAETVVVTPVGEADVSTGPDLRRALSEIGRTGRRRVVVDLDQLTFMDASTLSVLVETRQRMAAAGGTLQVWCSTRLGRRLLSITSLEGMLDDRP